MKAVLLAKKNHTPVIFDIDYREYNWRNKDEISIYYSMVAKEAAIIMGSREEFDLTERLICSGMSDKESAAYWHGCGAKIVVIKHGMQGSTAYTDDGQEYSIKPFPVEARKGFGGGDGYGSGFLYGLYSGWEIIDCLEFGSAEPHDGEEQQLLGFPSRNGGSKGIHQSRKGAIRRNDSPDDIKRAYAELE